MNGINHNAENYNLRSCRNYRENENHLGALAFYPEPAVSGTVSMTKSNHYHLCAFFPNLVLGPVVQRIVSLTSSVVVKSEYHMYFAEKKCE